MPKMSAARILLPFLSSLAALSLAGAAAAQDAHDHTSHGGHAAVRPECAAARGAARSGGTACTLEEHLLAVLARDGVEAAMAALDGLARDDEKVRQDAHSYAHAIGIAAYDGDEEVGTVFGRCTPAYQSGCFHGVIQSYFTQHLREHGGHLSPETVNALCRVQREVAGDRWLLFQCAHGMGHGMVMLANGHLLGALNGCDMVADSWERESCYGGVFMENIVRVTMPDHTTGRPDAGATHEHAAQDVVVNSPRALGEGLPEFPPLLEDQPLYPCSVLDERYQVSCYQMQTSAILYFNGSDIGAASRACAAAPEPYRPVCFQSLGRDISSMTLQDHQRAMRLCATAPAEFQPWCTIGYTKNLIDVTADPADGFAYCRLLPAGESKRFCYIAVGEQIWVLVEDRARREAMCSSAEAAYRDECLHGAGLTEPNAWTASSPPLALRPE